MKSFWGLVPRYIIKNKKKVLSLAVGIFLSISLITALDIMKESLINAAIQVQKNWLGSYYDVSFNTTNKKISKKFNEDSVIQDATTMLAVGTMKFENSSKELSINGYENNIMDFMNMTIIEGNKPQADKEIAIEEWILASFEKEYKIGDKIKLKYKLNGNGKEEVYKEEEFTLVGIIKYKSSWANKTTVGIGWVTKEYGEKVLGNGKYSYTGYLNLKDNSSINNGVVNLDSNGGYSDVTFKGNIEKTVLLNNIKLIKLICYILFIIFGFVVGINIYNLFQVIVEERRNQYGILKVLGATPRKIEGLVIMEGITIGILVVPIGIILSNILIRGIMVLIGYDSITNIFKFSSVSVIASLIVEFTAIIIGTYIPAKKAAKMTPIDAIRNLNVVSTNKVYKRDMERYCKRHKFTSAIALINIKRNTKKLRTSVISLAMTIVLLITACYLIKQVDPTERFINDFGNIDFKLTTDNDIGLMDEEINKIVDIDGITITSREKTFYGNISANKEMVTEEGVKYLNSQIKNMPYLQDDINKGIYDFSSMVFGYDEGLLKKLDSKILDGTIECLNNTEPTMIIVQGLNASNYTKFKVGDDIELLVYRFNEKGEKTGVSINTFKVGAIVDAKQFQIEDGRISIAVIMSDEMISKYLDCYGYNLINLTIDKKVNYDEAFMNLKENIKPINYAQVSSFKEEYAAVKKQNLEISVILYGFIAIVAAISLINLFNIMRINVLLRIKEVGMLRATGLSVAELKKMMRNEGFIYGIFASVGGCTVGILITYLIALLVPKASWEFPIMTILIISVAVIFITAVSSVLASLPIYKIEIVEAIRNVE